RHQVYGAGRTGWFVATHRFFGPDQDSGLQPLAKGEWPTQLHLIERCGFWSLPEEAPHLANPTVTVEDGEWLTIIGRGQERHRRVDRFVWREPGSGAVLSFGCRVSGFFVRHPVSRFWVPRVELELEPPSPL